MARSFLSVVQLDTDICEVSRHSLMRASLYCLLMSCDGSDNVRARSSRIAQVETPTPPPHADPHILTFSRSERYTPGSIRAADFSTLNPA